MKSTLLLIALLLFTTTSFAEEKRIAASFIFEKTEPATHLSGDDGLYHFKFSDLDPEDQSATITLSCDSGENEFIQLKKGAFEYKAPEGSHQFTIYVNDNYFEVYSHNLPLTKKEKHFYSIRTIRTNGLQIEVDKPVIYLYPETTSTFEITVEPTGEMQFTYPEYTEKWTGTMHPKGKLEMRGEQFNYLFWESKQEMDALNPQETAGFIVTGKEIKNFLEEKLNTVGFTASERADFITYWGPQIQQHDQVYITFHQDSECDQFAALNISPTPDNLHRFYMSWGAYDRAHIPNPQHLTPMNREGFTVLEWGGQEVPTISNTLTL
ncbi:MAG: hypothetical protein ACFHU9_17220 [Fluviicola sp.]